MKVALSGLLNLEVTTRTRGFPIDYHPIDYPFFGVNIFPGGVGFNVAKAMKALGDEVNLYSLIGQDHAGELLKKSLKENGISSEHVISALPATPMSTILYDESGRRLIYCDLKDIQDRSYGFEEKDIAEADIVLATNINFSRPLLELAKRLGKTIATDVQVLADPDDDYNRDFMAAANILFLSDENVRANPEDFILEIERRYHNDIIVMGRGSKGSLMHLKEDGSFTYQDAYNFGPIKNTVGAGDAFFTAFVHFYGRGEAPKDALKLASAFAGIKVMADGASNGFVSEAEVRKALE